MDLELDPKDPVEDLISNLLTRPGMDPIAYTFSGSGVLEPVKIDIGHPSRGPLIKRITIEGFGPHEGPNILELDDGLTLVEGPNGSGKSHIVYAVNWCLFDKPSILDPWTEEMDDPSALVNWKGEKGASVAVEFELNREMYRFERSLRDGDESFSVKSLHEGKWRKESSRPSLDPWTSPFYLFQGETAMFMSADDPFSDRGVLHGLLESISGGHELDAVVLRLNEARERCLEMARTVGRKAEHLRGKLEQLHIQHEKTSSALQNSTRRVKELSVEMERTGNVYLEVIGRISASGAVDADEEITRTAERLGRLKERLAQGWRKASVTMIGPMARRALEEAMAFREEESTNRMLFGAYDAQLSIINEVIERQACICGAPIGRTGAGRKRLMHLKEGLEEKKEEASRWRPGSIWTSDQFLSTASRILGESGAARDELLELLKRFERENRKILLARGERNGGFKELLVEAVRENERAKVLLREEKERLAHLKKELQQTEESIRMIESEISSMMGGSPGNVDLSERVSLLNRTIEWIKSKRNERVEELRRKLEEISTEIFGSITGRNNVHIYIHRETFRIGVGMEHEGGIHLSSLSRLSAGERETVVLSIILALADIIDITLIMDSPFSHMEYGVVENTMKVLMMRRKGCVVMVPTGSMVIKPGSGLDSLMKERVRWIRIIPGETGSKFMEGYD